MIILIKYVTFYAFSTENWKRSDEEVAGLMKLFEQYIKDVLKDNNKKSYSKERTRVIFLGDKSPFAPELREQMQTLEEKTAEFDGMTLMVAMNYGGRADIVYAAKRAASMLVNKEIKPGDFDESLLGSLLYTRAAPDVDLLIRPGGERRLSNFLLWQSAYAELYFTPTLWPDFNAKEFDSILADFASRNRRFGGV